MNKDTKFWIPILIIVLIGISFMIWLIVHGCPKDWNGNHWYYSNFGTSCFGEIFHEEKNSYNSEQLADCITKCHNEPQNLTMEQSQIYWIGCINVCKLEK